VRELTKQRTDIPERIVYKSRGINEDHTIPIMVDDSTYYIECVIAFFHKPKPTRIFPHPDWICSLIYPSHDILNLSKKLSHMRPDIDGKKLYRLFQNGIKKGLFQPLSEDGHTVRMFLTVDSWLKLQPVNDKSKWTITSLATLNSVIKSQSSKPPSMTQKIGH